MNAGKHDTAMEGCSLDAQKRYQSNLSLRARHLQSSSRAQEKKLNDLYLQLMGSDRVAAESAAGFDGLEAALKKRQNDLEWLLQTTESAIARKRTTADVGPVR
ncbi:unnamed protein product [Symbiodinium pilosum]|uniref:Uncharacterized protein n=1 Tax=Symbiodinium pilosum TaxID=2952 RepID=A0A812MYW2_SYMPI|nr:unnamed protein product [Symbiodinium pilosum]